MVQAPKIPVFCHDKYFLYPNFVRYQPTLIGNPMILYIKNISKLKFPPNQRLDHHKNILGLCSQFFVAFSCKWHHWFAISFHWKRTDKHELCNPLNFVIGGLCRGLIAFWDLCILAFFLRGSSKSPRTSPWLAYWNYCTLDCLSSSKHNEAHFRFFQLCILLFFSYLFSRCHLFQKPFFEFSKKLLTSERNWLKNFDLPKLASPINITLK